MTLIERLFVFLSWVAVIELPALGWRLQGWWGVGIGFGIGFMFWNWAHDWEVRKLMRAQREERARRPF
jgi:hypothetical protein